MRLFRSLVLACLCVVVPASVFAITKDPLSVKLPPLEILPGAEWYWVGEKMALNGVPMSVKMFSYKGKPEDIVRFYQSYWRGLGNGKQNVQHLGKRTILGFQLDEFYYSIQFEEEDGLIKGKAVVTPTPLNIQASKKTTLPIPARSRVHSRIESLDFGRREETLAGESDFDIGYVVDFYKSQLGGEGWQLFSSSGDQRNSAVLSFQRGGELLQLTAKALQHSNSQKTQFLIHWLK